MSEFLAFDGLEYDTATAGALCRLLAPPYDAISPRLRSELAGGSPYNVVHVTLGEPADGLDRYQAAGRLVRRWRQEGALVRGGRAFYLLEQRFERGGESLVRTAIIGHVRLGPWGASGIYPHEVTLSKPKEDRLKLYCATQLQPGPVFLLFEEKDSRVYDYMRQLSQAPPSHTARGPEGADDRIWKITDAATIASLEESLAGKRFFVADGHHRYETALAYRDHVASCGRLPADHPANFVLAAAVSFSDPGLCILPTHRLLHLQDPARLPGALDTLEKDYRIEPAGRMDSSADRGLSPGTIALYTPGRWRLLRLKDEARDRLSAGVGAAAARLNVIEVRYCILEKFFDDVDAAVADERIRYTHDIDEALRQVDSHSSEAAVILSAIQVSDMAAAAIAGELMPPKSTYFFPKIPTGIVQKPLE